MEFISFDRLVRGGRMMLACKLLQLHFCGLVFLYFPQLRGCNFLFLPSARVAEEWLHTRGLVINRMAIFESNGLAFGLQHQLDFEFPNIVDTRRQGT